MIENATFYIPDPTVFGTKLFDRFPEINSAQPFSTEEVATGMLLETTWGEIKFNVMPPEQMGPHLNSFANFIHQHCPVKSDDMYMRGRLTHVRWVLGCNIKHEPNQQQTVGQFLLRFNDQLNGTLFFDNTVWDWNGKPMVGRYAERPT
ncbi:MAG: hypothetical protein AAGD96_23215 [Chloroflexota bacterium]